MITSLITLFSAAADAASSTAADASADPSVCHFKDSSFFNFPHWYKFLDGVVDPNGACVPKVGALSDVWLIVAAIIEILLRIAALLAVAMVLYGGISYIMSQGEPEKTGQAKDTIVNALVGLAIAIMASFIITFIAGSIK